MPKGDAEALFALLEQLGADETRYIVYKCFTFYLCLIYFSDPVVLNGRPDATDTTARMRKLHTQRSKEKLEQQDREVEELAQGGRKRAAEEDNAEKKQRRRLQRQTV